MRPVIARPAWLIQIVSAKTMKLLDALVALMLAGSGLAAVLYSPIHQKRVSDRVDAGDISDEQGRKEMKAFRFSGYGMLVIGVGLLLLEAPRVANLGPG